MCRAGLDSSAPASQFWPEWSCWQGKFPPHVLQRAVFRLQSPFELGILHLGKNFLEARPGQIAGRDQVIAADERRGTNGLRRNRGDSLRA